MASILFATTNPQKLELARAIAAIYNYEIESINLDIDEIQGEDPEPIIRDKAQRAYEALGKPVVVSDDSWAIHALGGFPGPYMKSVNHWFKPEDFMALMQGHKNRRISLYQYLAYTDGKVIKIFHNEIPGVIVDTPRGGSQGPPIMRIVALDHDNGKTIAEVFELSASHFSKRYTNHREVWHDLLDWHLTN